MRLLLSVLLLKIYFNDLSICYGETNSNIGYKLPTVGISVLVRNKAHTLPYFLTSIYNLDYPKDRLYLWIYSDFNEDDSIKIIHTWVEKHSSEYKKLYITSNSSSGTLHSDETKSVEWTVEHFKHVINLREKALEFSRKMWADYIFMIDADVFLTNPLTLRNLISKELDVVAPMLVSDGLYSNFWLASKLMHESMCNIHKLVKCQDSEMKGLMTIEDAREVCKDRSSWRAVVFAYPGRNKACAMTDKYYYMRTDDYKLIQKRTNIGCFNVPMVHTAVLINMKTFVSDSLTYDPKKVADYNGPIDDIIAFAINAKQNGVELVICNDEIYGYIPVPLEERDTLKIDYEQLLNTKMLAISRGTPLALEPYMQAKEEYPDRWKYGCSKIYMINLERRTERRKFMEMSFKELGMDVTYFPAVDGRTLDMKNLKDRSITLMPNYADPYHQRPMKAGEVGCFLSHYYIWEQIVEEHTPITMILEDDIKFVSFFRTRLLQLMSEIEELDWDLVYLGRKILMNKAEEHVTPHTTKPLYSYWTLGYLITERGARKLLDAKPLDNVLPVDEFLPIMFDQHPNDSWKDHFPVRNIKAYSAAPLLVNPTHYTGFRSNETNSKKESVNRKESNRQNEDFCDCAVGELGELLSEHYFVMSECLSRLDCSLDGLSATVDRPVLPCAAQRSALQLCYTSHTAQPLRCQRLVAELMECARNHALPRTLNNTSDA